VSAELRTAKNKTAFIPAPRLYSVGVTNKVQGRVRYPAMWSEWTGLCTITVRDGTLVGPPVQKPNTCFHRAPKTKGGE